MSYLTANKWQNSQTLEDAVILSIESLLRTSGYESFHIVSLHSEANKYCYKTFDGTIGTVDQSFIHDRITFPHS